MGSIQSIRSLLSSLWNDEEVVVEDAPIRGCMDETATNYDPTATIDIGTCTYDEGYGSGSETPDPETGTGDDSGYGSGAETPDPEAGTGNEGGSGYEEIA